MGPSNNLEMVSCGLGLHLYKIACLSGDLEDLMQRFDLRALGAYKQVKSLMMVRSDLKKKKKQKPKPTCYAT